MGEGRERGNNKSQVYKENQYYSVREGYPVLKYVYISLGNVGFPPLDIYMPLSSDEQILMFFDSLSLSMYHLDANVGYLLALDCIMVDVQTVPSRTLLLGFENQRHT